MNIATKKVDVTKEAAALLEKMGVAKELYTGGNMPSFSPVTGEKIGNLKTVSAAEAAATIEQAHEAFKVWRLVPAPKRGELIRLLGEELRTFKADLGRLVSIEAGKITSEGLGEVQEMIDICDFAVGLSRQLYGLTIATERPGGMNGAPSTIDAGSVTRNFFDGDGSTAARGRRAMPSTARNIAEAADHSAALPRKSRRGIGSSSKRDALTASLGEWGLTVMEWSSGSRPPRPVRAQSSD